MRPKALMVLWFLIGLLAIPQSWAKRADGILAFIGFRCPIDCNNRKARMRLPPSYFSSSVSPTTRQESTTSSDQSRRRTSDTQQPPTQQVVGEDGDYNVLFEKKAEGESHQSPSQIPFSRRRHHHPSFHLLSLNYTTPPSIEAAAVGVSRTGGDMRSGNPPTPKCAYSKVVTDIWRWKDTVLGDGRDFFVPRPKTLQALASFLIEEEEESIQECIILSNCARFEVLLVQEQGQPPSPAHGGNDDLLLLNISRKLVAQCRYYQSQVHPATKWMVTSMDWPGVIGTTTTHRKDMDEQQEKQHETLVQMAKELQSHWTHLTKLEEIMDHLARVACGMAWRPRRPDRPVPFRPFPSRDAHILLQLKRTVQAFSHSPASHNVAPAAAFVSSSTSSPRSSSSSSVLLIQLLQWALQAGKAARNVHQVPELKALRPYGSGDSQKYSAQPPSQLLHNVTQVSDMLRDMQDTVKG